METKSILLLGVVVVLACAMTRAKGRNKPAWAQQLKGWQKIFGALAVVLALLIILNPEFLALGLLGDTAFFDLLVLALSLQMHQFVSRAWHWCVTTVTKGMRWLRVPSPGLLYLFAVCSVVMASTHSAWQKVWQRISS